ncbi:MAG: MFS transporter, partial [Bacteroidota bacterium]
MTEGQEVSSRWPGYRFFRRNPSFFRFWCAAVINRSGDSLDTIAHMWLVLELTGSTMMMGTIMVANMLPSIILGPFTGVLADRWDRKRLVVICDIMRGLVMAGVAALLFLGHLKAAYLYVSAVLVS